MTFEKNETLHRQWMQVKRGDPTHEKCKLIVRVMREHGPSMWASDIAIVLGIDVQRVRDLLHHLTWHGKVQYLATGPAVLKKWEGGKNTRAEDEDEGTCFEEPELPRLRRVK